MFPPPPLRTRHERRPMPEVSATFEHRAIVVEMGEAGAVLAYSPRLLCGRDMKDARCHGSGRPNDIGRWWWRRGELNPRPVMGRHVPLRA